VLQERSRYFEMSQFPFFSVIIPTYNRAAFIEETIESVLEQSYPHYEIIVVDNCSTDNTVELLEPFIRAGRIQFIKHEENFERARSRNTGMSAARGDFVTFLDSDDFMYRDNLRDAAEYARAHPESLCFHSLFELVDGQRNVIYNFKFPSLKNQIRAIAYGNFMSCIGDFIHREIYTKYKFDTRPEVTGSEDWDFWLRVLADYKVGRIAKINNGIRHHEGRSVNNQNMVSLQQGLEQIIAKIKGDPHLRSVYKRYLKRIEATSLIYMAILANSGFRYREALRCLQGAVAKDISILASRRFIKTLQIALFKLNVSGFKTRGQG
jgi:glycosyltransferase involved in cell wall biosynthesis